MRDDRAAGEKTTLINYQFQGFEADIELLWPSIDAIAPNGLIIHVKRDGCCLHRMRTCTTYPSAQDAVEAGELLVRLFVSVEFGRL